MGVDSGLPDFSGNSGFWKAYPSIAKLAIIEMGAGRAVPTVRLQSERATGNIESTLIRINPRDYEVPYGAIGLPLGAKEGIDRILVV